MTARLQILTILGILAIAAYGAPDLAAWLGL